MRKISRKVSVAVLLVLAVSAVFTTVFFAGCNKLESIGISKANMPRLTYVQGQNLDLDDGMLTVNYKKETKNIPLSSAEVTVSGYDKNKLGQQEVTVTYEKQSTTFTVNVVARIVVKNQEVNYFVGSEFNKEKGSLIITRDDISSYEIRMDDERVTIEGFNSQSPVTNQNVTVRYQDSAVNYTGNFNVNIYNVESTTFTQPSKIAYETHEEGLDLSGGFITIKAANGTLTDYIEITEDMIVSGNDLSNATLDNRENPLKQNVVIEYAGKQYSYEINIKFSDVSLIKLRASEAAVLDWTGNSLPDVSETLGANALEAALAYTNLKEAQKNLITEEERLSVVRAATVYGLEKFKQESEVYGDVFTINTSGSVVWACESYEAVETALSELQESDNSFVKISKQMSSFAQAYKDDILAGTVTVSAFLAPVFDVNELDDLLLKMDFMLELSDSLATVPEAWTTDALNKDVIENATDIITSSGITSRALYSYVSSWRKNDDFFEIIYSYYYNIAKNGTADAAEAANATINTLKGYALPGEVEDLYNAIINCIVYVQYASQYGYNYSVEITPFMVYYAQATKAIGQINSGNSAMQKDFLATMTFENLLTIGGKPAAVTFAQLMNFVTTTSGGYYSIQGIMLGDAEYDALWNKYTEVILNYSDEYAKTTEFKTAVADLLKQLVEMTPADQFGFITTLYPYMSNYSAPSIGLDITNYKYSIFTAYLDVCYTGENGILPESAKPIFKDMLIALEAYARRYQASDALTLFKSKMAAVEAAYSILSAEDKAVFDDNLGYFYSKYMTIYNREKNNQSLTLPLEWVDEIATLTDAIKTTNAMIMYLNNYKLNIYNMVIAAYEQMQNVVDYILENAPQAVLDYYYYEEHSIFSNISYSLEFTVNNFTSYYVSYLTGLTIGGESLYDLYTPTLAQFYVESFNIPLAYLTKTLAESSTTEGEPEEVIYFESADEVLAVMEAFRNLSLSDKKVFYAMDTYGLYYGGLNLFASEQLSEAGANAASKLFLLESAYNYYMISPDGKVTLEDETEKTYKQMLVDAMQEYKTAFDAMSEEEKAAFNELFADVATYYAQEYDKIIDTPVV